MVADVRGSLSAAGRDHDGPPSPGLACNNSANLICYVNP